MNVRELVPSQSQMPFNREFLMRRNDEMESAVHTSPRDEPGVRGGIPRRSQL